MILYLTYPHITTFDNFRSKSLPISIEPFCEDLCNARFYGPKTLEMVLSRDIIISITIYPTSFLKLSYYLNIKWVISSTNSKILTNLHHDRFIFERRRPLLKQCIMGSEDVITAHAHSSYDVMCVLTNQLLISTHLHKLLRAVRHG